MDNNNLHTPVGVKDFLPKQCIFKTELQHKIESVFKAYGYNSVSTPSFEHVEVFESKGSLKPSKIFKFVDDKGQVLALRSDMTPAIARIVATFYEEEDLPLRFSYFENTFRNTKDYQGKLREFTQAGIELIGVNSDDADAEVIAVSINSLLLAGLKDFRIDISNVEFLNGLIEEANLSAEEGLSLKQAIISKNYVLLSELIEKFNVPNHIKSFFEEVYSYLGDKSVIEKAMNIVKNEKSIAALKNLENIYNILQSYGLEKHVSFDLSILGHLEYYTGLIFRGYTYGVGTSIIDGGRYDMLLSEFGVNYPAVGFAIKIDYLLSKFDKNDIEINPDTLLVYTKEGRTTAFETADELRSRGVIIENSFWGGSLEKNLNYARKKNMGGILYFIDQENIKVINVITGEENLVKISELLSTEE